MKQRSTDSKKLTEHDEAWKALKAHPLDIEIEKHFATLAELQLWKPSEETIEQHMARYDAGKPQEIWATIKQLQAELHKTLESIRWFKSYRALYE